MSKSRGPVGRLRGWMLARVPGMITCRELDGFLVDYLDGTLPAAVRGRFAVHLAICPECRRYLAGYRRTVALAREGLGGDEPPPGEVPEALVASVLAAIGADPERD